MKYSATDIARQFIFVVEAQEQNTGLMVESIQHWSGGQKGQSWCAYFILFVLDICFGGKNLNPVIRSGAVQDIYEQARKEGWIVENPMKDDLYIFVNDEDHAHHIGAVTDKYKFGISGNTSKDGLSSNGKMVAEHELNVNPAHIKYIRYPK